MGTGDGTRLLFRYLNRFFHSTGSKYGNRKTVIDGITFDSAKEGLRYAELKLLHRAGAIKNLWLQPKFTLLDGFAWQGEKVKPITYTPDFKLEMPDGTVIIEEVKSEGSRQARDYSLRVKLFKHRYPDLLFREI